MDSRKTIEKQKVLFFVDRIFWPANDGHKVVLMNYSKGLVEEYGCEVHVLAFLEAGQSAEAIEQVPSFISGVEIVKKPPKQVIASNLAVSLLSGVKGDPIQCALFRSPEAEAQLRSSVEKIQPTHVFFDLPRLSPFVDCIKDLYCKKVLYMEDAFSVRYARQLKSLDILKKTGGVAGKYSVNFKGGVARLVANPILQKLVLKMESKRMRRLELDAPKIFDYVVLVSPDEVAKLAEDTGIENIVAVPLGVDCSFYMEGPMPQAREGVLSFLGDMRASANADSLRYIADEVLPLIGRDIILEVSGNVRSDLVDEFVGDSRIKFLGRVEDTRETLRSSSVFLAPIAYGTGIKTKILEAMAIGVPVVTNSIGNEGIGLVDGNEAFVSDDPAELAECVRLLMDDSTLAALFVTSARRKAIEAFDWKKSLSNFARLNFLKVDNEEANT